MFVVFIVLKILVNVIVHFLEKWRHFDTSKILLCFRTRVRVRFRVEVSGNTFLVKTVFKQV